MIKRGYVYSKKVLLIISTMTVQFHYISSFRHGTLLTLKYFRDRNRMYTSTLRSKPSPYSKPFKRFLNTQFGIKATSNEFSYDVKSFDRDGQWMKIDYSSIPIEKLSLDENARNNDNLHNVFSPTNPSPVETKLINDRLVYIKRDDLLHLRNSNVSGNKARKMLALNELNASDFPDVVVSYGGPQSNAMVALAAVVQSKNAQLAFDENNEESAIVDEIENDGWIMKDEKDAYDRDDDLEDDHESTMPYNFPGKKRFVYYTKKLPRYLRNQPNGNLLRALTLGMEMVQLKADVYKDLFGGNEGGSATAPIDAPIEGKSLWIPQGGACGLALQGARCMADEILSYWMNNGKRRPLSVCVPGGTCTTAMLLSRELNEKIRKVNSTYDDNERIDIDVVVIPCVGNAEYAFRQMRALDTCTGGNGRDDIPKILKPIKRKGYFRFGEPDAEILQTFLEMRKEHGLFLDLLYGAPAMNILLEHLQIEYSDVENQSPLKGRQIMYVHSGGLEGVSSQLTRYKHKGLIDAKQVQN